MAQGPGNSPPPGRKALLPPSQQAPEQAPQAPQPQPAAPIPINTGPSSEQMHTVSLQPESSKKPSKTPAERLRALFGIKKKKAAEVFVLPPMAAPAPRAELSREQLLANISILITGEKDIPGLLHTPDNVFFKTEGIFRRPGELPRIEFARSDPLGFLQTMIGASSGDEGWIAASSALKALVKEALTPTEKLYVMLAALPEAEENGKLRQELIASLLLHAPEPKEVQDILRKIEQDEVGAEDTPLFGLVSAFCRKALEHSSSSKMTPQALGICFAPNFIIEFDCNPQTVAPETITARRMLEVNLTQWLNRYFEKVLTSEEAQPQSQAGAPAPAPEDTTSPFGIRGKLRQSVRRAFRAMDNKTDDEGSTDSSEEVDGATGGEPLTLPRPFMRQQPLPRRGHKLLHPKPPVPKARLREQAPVAPQPQPQPQAPAQAALMPPPVLPRPASPSALTGVQLPPALPPKKRAVVGLVAPQAPAAPSLESQLEMPRVLVPPPDDPHDDSDDDLPAAPTRVKATINWPKPPQQKDDDKK